MAFLCKTCIESFSYYSNSFSDGGEATWKDIEKSPKKRHKALRCPKCKNSDNFVEIDDLLIHPIKVFWKNGILTGYCCSGHSDTYSNKAYITFISKSVSELDILEKIISSMDYSNISIDLISPKLENYSLPIYSEEEVDFKNKEESVNICSVNFANFLWAVIRKMNLKID